MISNCNNADVWINICIRPPSWIIQNAHISATGHAIRFAFGSVVGFRVGGSNVSTSVWTKSKIAAVIRLV